MKFSLAQVANRQKLTLGSNRSERIIFGLVVNVRKKNHKMLLFANGIL
jgi:hypothetical protein